MTYAEVCGDASGVIKAIADTAQRTYADKVKIDTTLFSTEIRPSDDTSKTGSAVLKLLRPKVTVLDANGALPTKPSPMVSPRKSRDWSRLAELSRDWDSWDSSLGRDASASDALPSKDVEAGAPSY